MFRVNRLAPEEVIEPPLAMMRLPAPDITSPSVVVFAPVIVQVVASVPELHVKALTAVGNEMKRM